MNDADRTPVPPDAPRKRRRWGVLAWIVVAVLVLLAVVAVAFRDAPRRFVARTLARELQADVRIGRLEILGTDRFALHDLVIRDPAPWPAISEIRIAVLRVEGAIDDVREARFAALQVESPTVLVRVPPRPAPPPTDEAPPEVGRLEIRAGTLVAVAAGGTFRARFRADLRDLPRAPAGELTIEAGSDPIGPLVAVALAREDLSAFDCPTGVRLDRPCEGLTVRASLEAAGSGHASVRGRCAVRDARGETRSIGFEGEVSATPSDAGRDLRITAGIDPGIAIRAAGTWPGAGAARWESAELAVPDLGSALAIAAVLPAGADVTGEAEVRATRGPTGTLDVVADARIARASGAFVGVDAIAEAGRIEFRSELSDDDLDRQGTVRGSISVERLAARGRGFIVPADLGAWTATFEGDVALAAAPRFAGRLDLTVPGVGPLRAEGEVRVPPETGSSVDVEVRAGRLSLSRVLAVSRRVGPAVPTDLEVEGEADLRIVARGPIDSLTLDGAVEGHDVTVAHGAGKTARCSRIEARAAIAPDGSADVRAVATDLLASIEDRHVETATVTVGAVGSLDGALDLTLDARGLAGRLPGVAVLESGRAALRARRRAGHETRIEQATCTGAIAPVGWPLRTLTIATSGVIDPDGRVRVDPTSIELEGLARVEGSATLERGDGPVVGSARLVSADVAALRAWHRTGGRPLLDGYDLSLAPTFEATFRIDPDRAFSARGTAGWTGVSLQSDDGARALEGLDGAFAFDASGTAAGAGRLTATGSVEGFVMLWGRVFGDYAAFRPDVEATLRWGDPGGPAWVVDGRAALDDALVVEARAGAAEDRGMPWRFAVAADDLAAPFERWVRTPLVDSVSRLDRIRAGGGLTIDVEGTLGDDGSGAAIGAIAGRGLAIDMADTARVAGLDLDLPVDFAWTPAVDGGRPAIAGPARTGRLAFEQLDLMGIPVRAVSTELRVSGDTIGLRLPVEFDLLGGGVRIGSVTAAGLATAARRLEGRMEIAGVRLDRLAAALDLPPLDGSLDAAFPSVSLTPDVLRVEGGGEIRVFGGVVRLGDISGENMLTRFPKLTLSAEFEGIDLQQVTRTFDFGEMTGIVDGHIHDCELFRGIPVRFDATVATVARKGVPQAITVKAINNLTVLGTGGKANVFDRGIHRFLDRYRYEQLGVSARLEDDVFILRGGARRGDRELFLKGKLPFRLDVVNVRPGQSVSFRTMLDRVSHLDLSAASTSR